VTAMLTGRTRYSAINTPVFGAWVSGFVLFAVCAAASELSDLQQLDANTIAAQRSYLEAARETGDGTSERLQEAKRVYEELAAQLEAERIEALVEFTGGGRETIEQQRAGGVTWLEITTSMGVHPSIVGIEIIDSAPPPFVSGP